jgi:hypothetical protein
MFDKWIPMRNCNLGWRHRFCTGRGWLVQTVAAVTAVASCVTSLSVSLEPLTAQEPTHVEFFEQKILPVLVAKCYQCHSAQAATLEGGLRLDNRELTRQGGDSGPAIVAGNPAQSLLLTAITSSDNPMPPDERLPAAVVHDFRQWIIDGAIDPRDGPAELPQHEPDYSQARQYWAFRPVVVPAIPAVSNPAWCTSPIDRFILARLETEGLQPAPRAAPEILLRRVCLDLTGLPPTLEQLDAFLADPSDQTYRRIVDELLDSPHYGERQAQHWLDVVRFAETEGFEYDRHLPDMWRYRDYVIESFNVDKPYTQFVLEQLAGDELGDTPELRIAAGFHRLGAVRRNAGNQAVASSRNEVLTERTDIIGSAILGLTVGCARCHDHKFDPIPQRDYYRLQAFVSATEEENIALHGGAEQELLLARKQELESHINELKAQLANLDGEEEVRAKAEIKSLQAQVPADGPTICSIKNDSQHVAPVAILKRGDPNLPGPGVGMRGLGVLTADGQPELPFDTPQPRTRLAEHLLDPQHPLTARVMVNRLWQQHFGTGLVSTPNDFGKNGASPSHPELLDYLANHFVNQGWRTKSMHRELVTSRVYQQASRPTQTALEIDPSNRWLSHFPRRRLSGEEIRDAMLTISDGLNRSLGGPSVILPVEQQLVDQLYNPAQWEVTRDDHQHRRRSIYLLAKRNLRLPFMEVFDQPSSQTSCAVRQQSTHARQALELLNGPIANELAGQLVERLSRELNLEGSSVPLSWEQSTAVVHTAYRWVTARPPLEAEMQLSRQFVQEVGLQEFALAMFNLNAFLYVD